MYKYWNLKSLICKSKDFIILLPFLWAFDQFFPGAHWNQMRLRFVQVKTRMDWSIDMWWMVVIVVPTHPVNKHIPISSKKKKTDTSQGPYQTLTSK